MCDGIVYSGVVCWAGRSPRGVSRYCQAPKGPGRVAASKAIRTAREGSEPHAVYRFRLRPWKRLSMAPCGKWSRGLAAWASTEPHHLLSRPLAGGAEAMGRVLQDDQLVDDAKFIQVFGEFLVARGPNSANAACSPCRVSFLTGPLIITSFSHNAQLACHPLLPSPPTSSSRPSGTGRRRGGRGDGSWPGRHGPRDHLPLELRCLRFSRDAPPRLLLPAQLPPRDCLQSPRPSQGRRRFPS